MPPPTLAAPSTLLRRGPASIGLIRPGKPFARTKSLGMKSFLMALSFLTLLSGPVVSEVQVQRIGPAIMSELGTISCWLVQGEPVGRGVAVKIQGVKQPGEANILLDRNQLKELKALCKKALNYREKLQDGEIVVLGSLTSFESTLEAAVIRAGGMTARCLIVKEKDQEHTFVLENFQQTSLNRLLDQSMAVLR